MPRRTNDGINKRCRCPKRRWPKCTHAWHVNFHHAGTHHRYSLDAIASHRGEQPPKTKVDAVALRDRIRAEIRAGTFQPPGASLAEPAMSTTALTLGDVADRYLRDHVNREDRRAAGRALMVSYVAALRRVQVPGPAGTSVTLESKPMDAITTADVEHVRTTWRRRTAAAKGGRVGADRALKRLRHLFNWAIEKGYVEHTPFRRHGVTVVHFRRDEARTRRLEPGEEARLIEHASPFIQALIVAALETGCRRGELLGLRWRDVKAETGVLLLPGAITKTGEPRDVPMTQRLKAVLEIRRHAPDGTEHGPGAYVFGNEVGEPLKDIREAWAETCERAEITGLHFHDLRREFASRLRETPGVSDHHVRDWLGHADLTTTSRYLSTTRVGLQQARRAFERHSARFAHGLHTEFRGSRGGF